MVDAWKQARKAVESRYRGLCDILEKRKVKDEVTKATVLRDTVVLGNQPYMRHLRRYPWNLKRRTLNGKLGKSGL